MATFYVPETIRGPLLSRRRTLRALVALHRGCGLWMGVGTGRCKDIDLDSGEIAETSRSSCVSRPCDDDAGLGNLVGVELFCQAQVAYRTLVAATRLCDAVETWTVSMLWSGSLALRLQPANGLFRTLKVWGQDFDLAAGGLTANLFDDSTNARPAPTFHRRGSRWYDGVFEAELGDA